MSQEKVICHAYDAQYMQTGDETEGLHLWCLDRQSIPIHILFRNNPIYCYIELPNTPGVQAWNEDTLQILEDNIRRLYPKYAPIKLELSKKIKLYYYKGDTKTLMARAFFESVKQMNICVSQLTKNRDYPDFGNMIFRVYEKDISIRRKIFTIRKTRFCQWFELKNPLEISFDSPKRMATRGVEGREIREFIVNDIQDIIPIDPVESSGWATTPRVLSYDIETYSDNHHSLPDKMNPKHELYMISCLYQVSGDKSTRKRYVIVSKPCEKIDGAEVILVKNEAELLFEFQKLIELLDPEVLMGYNIYGYDNPYIDARYSMVGDSVGADSEGTGGDSVGADWGEDPFGPKCYEPMSRLQGYIPEMTNMSWASGAYGQTIISYLNMPGRISIDLYPLIRRNYKFDKYTLDFVSRTLLGSTKHDVTAQQMFEAFESSDISKMTRVTKYCIQDADLVIDLYEKMNTWIGLVEMANIVGVEIMEIFTRGQQIRCVSQIYDLTHRSGIVLNSRDTVELVYKGGFVGEPIVGIHEKVLVLDFSSLYPSIMQAYNICYTTFVAALDVDKYDPEDLNVIDVGDGMKFHFVKDHIRKGILPQLVENLVNERNAVRKQIKKYDQKIDELKSQGLTSETSEELKQLELTSIVLDKRQLGLKVSANSMYGFLGVQQGGKLPLIEGAISITAKGRELINRVNNFMIEKYDATVVYNDTDSSMVTIPDVKDRSEVNAWGHKIAKEVSAIFRDPLKMEFEKGMRFIGITKKKYAGFLIEDDGSFKLDRNGEEEIYKRGIIIARRDNFPYVRKVYTNVLRTILRRSPIQDTFKMILDSVVEILSGDLPARGNLTFIRGLGKEYKSASYFMKVFSDELARKGHPVAAGDRLEYVVVKGDDRQPLGLRMRLIEMYEDSLNYDESIEGPRPDTVYPVEQIDYMYYLTNGMQNPIDQLFTAGYQDELYKTSMYDVEYKPQNSAAKAVPIRTPIKMITTMLKDKTKKDHFTMQECIDFLRNDIYEWFLEQWDNRIIYEELQELDKFVDSDEEDED